MHKKQEISNILDVQTEILPIIYLGIPLSGSSLKFSDYNRLLDKIKKKLNGWSGRLLSLNGGLELIKTVVYPMTSFWIQVWQMTVDIIKKIGTIRANFLRAGKQHKINWDSVCKPKHEGGLGLRKIHDMQVVTSIKLLWKLLENKSLWTKWIWSGYCGKKNF